MEDRGGFSTQVPQGEQPESGRAGGTPGSRGGSCGRAGDFGPRAGCNIQSVISIINEAWHMCESERVCVCVCVCVFVSVCVCVFVSAVV